MPQLDWSQSVDFPKTSVKDKFWIPETEKTKRIVCIDPNVYYEWQHWDNNAKRYTRCTKEKLGQCYSCDRMDQGADFVQKMLQYRTNILEYLNVDHNGSLRPKHPVAWKIIPWAFGQKKKDELSRIKAAYGDLTKIDLIVSLDGVENFQAMRFLPSPESLYISHQLTAEVADDFAKSKTDIDASFGKFYTYQEQQNIGNGLKPDGTVWTTNKPNLGGSVVFPNVSPAQAYSAPPPVATAYAGLAGAAYVAPPVVPQPISSTQQSSPVVSPPPPPEAVNYDDLLSAL